MSAGITTTHNWFQTWSGRVDEWRAYGPDWEPGMPVGVGPTESAAIADLREQEEGE